MDAGQTRKYLLYAIGEIMLVMIGILLALQVNNWNEWRKDRIQEGEILEEIAETLEMNIGILDRYIQQLATSNRANYIILDCIENKTEYSDTLDVHFLSSFEQYTHLSLIHI